MRHPFNSLTKKEIQKLRRHTAVGNAKYAFSDADVDNAVKHLSTLYSGKVQRRFASTLLLLNELYMLTDIESADEFYPFTAKQLPTAKSIEKSDSKVSQAVNATVWN